MNISKDTKEDVLSIAAALLKRKPRTALDLAAALKCSKSHAYNVILRLRDNGWAVKAEKHREGSRGPAAKAYSIKGRSP